MPMIWLDLKEAGDFHFQSAVKKVSTPSPRISVVCPRVTPPLRACPSPGSVTGRARRFPLGWPTPPRPAHHRFLRLAVHHYGDPLPDVCPRPPAFLPRFSASLR